MDDGRITHEAYLDVMDLEPRDVERPCSAFEETFTIDD